jgi:ABC-type cobalamin/Fe3+-siderophores transport system ATPase subunit
VRIKYEQVVNQFEPEGLLEPAVMDADPAMDAPLKGEFVASNVTLSEGHAVKFLDGVSFTLPLDERVAIVGDGTSGKDELPLVLARLLAPTSGTLTLAGEKAAAIPEAVTGRRMAYVGPQAHLVSASLRDNLHYGLKHRPLVEPARDEHEKRRRARAIAEAEQAGNSTLDTQADWIDYAAAGAKGPEDLTARTIETLALVGMEDDIYQLGLRGRTDPAKRADIAAAVLDARRAFKVRLGDGQAASLIEPLDAQRYNTNATLAENLLFGTPVGDAFADENLATNAHVTDVLDKTGLAADLTEVGRKLAETMIELFSGLPPGHAFFTQFSFIGSDDLSEFQAILGRMSKGEVSPEDKARVLGLPFKYVVARHRLGLVEDALQARIVAARRVFAEGLPSALRGAIEFFDAGAYNAASSIQDNILFGRLAYGQAQGTERIGGILGEVVDSLGLRARIMEAGLDFQVGIGGARLTAGQRQKVAIARALLKRPDLMILNQPTATLDGPTQARIQSGLLERYGAGGLVWSLHRASLAKAFDRVLVLKAGRVAEQGRFEELNQPGRALHDLVQAE